MNAKTCLLILALLSMIVVGCSEEKAVEPQGVYLALAGEPVTIRPVSDFLLQQGTYCYPGGSGGCELIDAPVPNFLCWHDSQSGIMASVDYAAVAEQWLHEMSTGSVSCGTSCRGEIIEVPREDGRARVHVTLETKNALTWAERPRPARVSFGSKAMEVLEGDGPTLGLARIEIEFTNSAPGAPLPDLMQLIYAPDPLQEVHQISFYGRTEGRVHGKRALLEVEQEGLTLSIPSTPMGDGLPARMTLEILKKRAGR